MSIKVGIAQFAPVWLNKKESIDKTIQIIENASTEKVDIVVFGETFLPGYPFWLSNTKASEFDSKTQKELYSHYLKNSILPDDLIPIQEKAKELQIALYLGYAERASDRGSHSIYCSLAYIDKLGEIKSNHRKLQPTYEERLVWGQGDGNGLQTHQLNEFTIGALNCWENWMPLVRSSLYAQGENLHFASWPGSDGLTKDITKFIAKESRSFVVSASSILRVSDIPFNSPYYDLIINNYDDIISNGGSCIASPNGNYIIDPVVNKEELIINELNIDIVFEERQNFDPSGHYSRPDVTKLVINRERQSII